MSGVSIKIDKMEKCLRTVRPYFDHFTKTKKKRGISRETKLKHDADPPLLLKLENNYSQILHNIIIR